ncbi:MAG: cysteine desulfurase [Clostridia bacterium]|nr:cysteine desulfurase [Clostridia bacterium]
MEIYLDNSATTPLCEEAKAAVRDAVTTYYGNPSAVHAKGVEARRQIELARAAVAGVMGASPEEVYFSHSGTLANNTAVFGAALARAKQGNKIVTTATEHPSVLRAVEELEKRGFEVVRLAPGPDGAFDPAALASAVDKKTVLVSAMLVNNETGAVNPVECLSAAVKRAGAPALVHVDAIQGYGKLPFKVKNLGADLVTVSGHKVHGPKGVGALYMKKGVHIRPLVHGGGQENDLFSGTENVPGILGFGAAAKALGSVTANLAAVRAKRDDLLNMLASNPAVRVNSPKNALPYIVNLSVTGIPSQVLINYLSERGIYISAGSACKKGRRSDVLVKMGLPPARIDSAVRVSLSRFTTSEELHAFAHTLDTAVREIRTKL